MWQPYHVCTIKNVNINKGIYAVILYLRFLNKTELLSFDFTKYENFHCENRIVFYDN